MKPVRPSVGKKGGGAALGSGGQLPVRVCGGVPPPLIELVEARGVGSVCAVGGHPCGDHRNDYDGKHKKTFGHRGGL